MFYKWKGCNLLLATRLADAGGIPAPLSAEQNASCLWETPGCQPSLENASACILEGGITEEQSLHTCRNAAQADEQFLVFWFIYIYINTFTQLFNHTHAQTKNTHAVITDDSRMNVWYSLKTVTSAKSTGSKTSPSSKESSTWLSADSAPAHGSNSK